MNLRRLQRRGFRDEGIRRTIKVHKKDMGEGRYMSNSLRKIEVGIGSNQNQHFLQASSSNPIMYKLFEIQSIQFNEMLDPLQSNI